MAHTMPRRCVRQRLGVQAASDANASNGKEESDKRRKRKKRPRDVRKAKEATSKKLKKKTKKKKKKRGTQRRRKKQKGDSADMGWGRCWRGLDGPVMNQGRRPTSLSSKKSSSFSTQIRRAPWCWAGGLNQLNPTGAASKTPVPNAWPAYELPGNPHTPAFPAKKRTAVLKRQAPLSSSLAAISLQKRPGQTGKWRSQIRAFVWKRLFLSSIACWWVSRAPQDEDRRSVQKQVKFLYTPSTTTPFIAGAGSSRRRQNLNIDSVAVAVAVGPLTRPPGWFFTSPAHRRAAVVS